MQRLAKAIGETKGKKDGSRRSPSRFDRRMNPRQMSTFELLESRQLLSTYQVTNTVDDGNNDAPYAGSLRAAILAANNDPGSTITFNIGSGGPQTISVVAPLPALTKSVTIDGTTQPGYAGRPLIEIMASQQIDPTTQDVPQIRVGLEVDGGNSTVRGLSIDGFQAAGLLLNVAGGDLVQGNWIGTLNPSIGVGANVGIQVDSDNNLIGGAGAPNRNVIAGNGWDGVALVGNGNQVVNDSIGIDADNHPLGNNNNGITVTGNGSTISGNLISGNNGDGILFTNVTSGVVKGNTIGLDATGELRVGNTVHGIELDGSSGVVIGGTSAGDRNVISGNKADGILLDGSSSNTIQGNYVGLDAGGTLLSDANDQYFGNDHNGIHLIHLSANNQIGGSAAGAGNAIAGSGDAGVNVEVDGAAGGNVIQGNRIGTDAAGLTSLGNFGSGVDVESGGTVTITGNLISGNREYGILSAATVVARGNMIGLGSDGRALGNRLGGVYLSGSNNVIGGTAASQGNVIADNGFPDSSIGPSEPGSGVTVAGGTGNAIRGNSIYGNALIGIDLLEYDANGPITGVTDNGTATAPGPNNYQYFPVLGAASSDGTTLTISGTVTGTPGQTYHVDLFASQTANVTGYGEGQTYLGSVDVTCGSDGKGTFSASVTGAPAGQLQISATATDASGNTSEFAHDVTEVVSTPAPQPVDTKTTLSSSATTVAFGQSVTFTATVSPGAGTQPLTGTVTFLDGSTVLAVKNVVNGQASFSTSSLSTKGHTITAVYSGDANYNSSSDTLTETVRQNATSATLTTSAGTVTAGQTVTLTSMVSLADVGSGTPTGTVTVMDGSNLVGYGTIDASGKFVISGLSLAVGTHTLVAYYGGDTNFMGSNSAAVTVTVNPLSGSISGRTLNDITGNGLSSDDAGLASVKVNVFLDRNNNGTLDSGDGAAVATLISGNGGGYSLAGLAAGRYFVQEVVPTDYVRTAPTTSTYYTATITASGNSVTGLDFDNYHAVCNCDLTKITYTVNGCRTYTDLRGQIHEGDVVTVHFTVPAGHTDTVSLVSYTAPGATFSASTASQQRVYDFQTQTFTAGTYTLTVKVPPTYFQVDFVCGYVIDHFGPAGSNIFYSAQDRLYSADNGGVHKVPTNLLPLHAIPSNYP